MSLGPSVFIAIGFFIAIFVIVIISLFSKKLGENYGTSLRVYQFQSFSSIFALLLLVSIWLYVPTEVLKEFVHVNQTTTYWYLKFTASLVVSVVITYIITIYISKLAYKITRKLDTKTTEEETLANLNKATRNGEDIIAEINKITTFTEETMNPTLTKAKSNTELILKETAGHRHYFQKLENLLLSEKEPDRQIAKSVYYGAMRTMKSIATDNSADIHLCISLDDSIPQLYSTISGMTLLLVDRQRRWADQEKEKISNGGKYFTCNPRKNEVEKVEAILHQAIELCMKNLKEESALLEPDWANLNIIKPRAIRIIYSTTRDLINGCLDYPGEGFSIFPGISKNSVWNLWLSKEILDTMDVLSWGNTTEKELKENAGNTPPKWIKYFRPLKADKSLFDLINDMAGACRFTVNFDTICKQYTEYCHKPDGPDVKNLQQMCIGEHYWIKSGDLQFANPATEKGTCKSAFFELLPVILMALHCKKLIPFEDAIQWAATLEDYADEQIDLKIQEKEAEIQNWIET